MTSFILFISAYFTVAACVHRLCSEASPSQRIMAWLGLSLGLVFSCAILFPMPGLVVVTLAPVSLCAIGGLWASKHTSLPAKIVVMTVAVGVAVGLHVEFGRNAPKQFGGGLALSECRANLEKLSGGLTSYRESVGRNPDSLKSLTPDHLEALPKCPAANSVTYQLGGDAEEPVIFCGGHSHGRLGVPEDYPRAVGAKINSGVPEDNSFDWYEFH